MNARDSLLELYSNMVDEFNSSNNRVIRDVDSCFSDNLNDLTKGMLILNSEYKLIDFKEMKDLLSEFKKQVNEIKVKHISNYENSFQKELPNLKNSMFNFFKNKLVKEKDDKRKMSKDIKGIMEKMCDYNLLELDEILDNFVYDFKVNFEMKYVHSEYSRDDFNKIIRAFNHSLMQSVRECLVNSTIEKQEIVSRYASKSYSIVDHYKEMKR